MRQAEVMEIIAQGGLWTVGGIVSQRYGASVINPERCTPFADVSNVLHQLAKYGLVECVGRMPGIDPQDRLNLWRAVA